MLELRQIRHPRDKVFHPPRITTDGKRNLDGQDKEVSTHKDTSTSADLH